MVFAAGRHRQCPGKGRERQRLLVGLLESAREKVSEAMAKLGFSPSSAVSSESRNLTANGTVGGSRASSSCTVPCRPHLGTRETNKRRRGDANGQKRDAEARTAVRATRQQNYVRKDQMTADLPRRARREVSIAFASQAKPGGFSGKGSTWSESAAHPGLTPRFTFLTPPEQERLQGLPILPIPPPSLG
jgi:hypothetical protein